MIQRADPFVGYWDAFGALDLVAVTAHHDRGAIMARRFSGPLLAKLFEAVEDREAKLNDLAASHAVLDQPPIPVDSPGKLKVLCGVGQKLLTKVCSLPDDMYDARPIVRATWAILRSLPGKDKPPMPRGELTAHDAIAELERVAEWCGGRKRGGRRKADVETVQREAKFAAKWERARGSKVYKSVFAKQNKLTTKQLDRLLDRVYARKARSFAPKPKQKQ